MADDDKQKMTPQNTPDCTKPECETKGEKIFNYTTYGVIGFLLNLGMSVVITDYFTHGKGTKILDGLTKGTTKMVNGHTGMDAKKVEGFAHSFWKTNLLLSGGHIVMAPIKILEDNKRRIVHWINEKLGIDKPIMRDGKEVPLSQLKDEELPPLYEDQPKQGWLNVIKRRLMGAGTTITIGTLMGKNLQHKVEDIVTDKAMMPMAKAIPIEGVQKVVATDRFQRYTRLVSLDQFFTVITSFITYVTNGAKSDAKEAEQLSTPTTPAVEAPEAPTQTTPSPVVKLPEIAASRAQPSKEELTQRASFVDALNRQSPNTELAV